MKPKLLIIFILIAILGAGFLFLRKKNLEEKILDKTPGATTEKPGLIRVASPLPNQIVESPLTVTGEAIGKWFFEASFPVKIFDDNNYLLGVTPAQAQGEWMTENFVPFKAKARFAVPSSGKGVLVLEKDNPSGLPQNADELRIPIEFAEISGEAREKMKVKIFLSDSRFVNEPYFDCSRTISADREVFKTKAVGAAAIEALLRGANENEMAQNYFSNINPGTRLEKLTIENGIARADFDEQLEFQVGGSCRVAAIRAQITDTLKQFPTVKEVIISVNGRTEDILQP